MGGLTRRVICFREDGVINLTFGRQDIELDFPFDVDDVYVSCVSNELPVCQGDLNWVSVTTLDKGFILHANVQTATADIQYIVIGSLGNRIAGS